MPVYSVRIERSIETLVEAPSRAAAVKACRATMDSGDLDDPACWHWRETTADVSKRPLPERWTANCGISPEGTLVAIEDAVE